MQADPSNERPVCDGTAQLAEKLGITAEHIRELRTKSKTIDEICDDYAECISRLDKLAQLGDANSLHVQDYRELRDQLEQELRRQLVQSADSGESERGEECI